MEVVKFIDSGKRLSRPAKAELEVYSMMTWCWEQEPQKRPKFLELFKFFSENPEYSNLKELLISQDLNFQDWKNTHYCFQTYWLKFIFIMMLFLLWHFKIFVKEKIINDSCLGEVVTTIF